MIVGDLVECIQQPGVHFTKDGHAVLMPYNIFGEIGIIINVTSIGTYEVAFPKFSHVQCMSSCTIVRAL